MRVAVPQAFHGPPTLIDIYNRQYNLNIPPPIPMAEAWLIFKSAVLATDYKQDIAFICIY